MDIPLQPMWSFQREMTKIDKMCLSKQAFDEFDELSINRPSKQSAGYIVNKHQLLTISKQHMQMRIQESEDKKGSLGELVESR